MLYELRSYDIDPSRWDEYLDWAYTRAWPVMFGQFGFRLVGWWQAVSHSADSTSTTNLYWLLAWENEEEMREKSAALRNSDDWRATLAAETDPTTGKRLYILKTRSTLLQSLPRSPMQ